MAQRDLKRVAQARAAAMAAQADLRQAMLEAAEAGETQADIAAWANLSRGRVQQLLAEARRQARNQDGAGTATALALLGVACTVLQAISPNGCPMLPH